MTGETQYLPIVGAPDSGAVPRVAWISIGVATSLLLAVFSSNTVTMFAAVVFVPVLLALLWRRQEPPVLVFVLLIQWLQITTTVFLAEANGLMLEEFSGGPETESAVRLSLAGLLALALGIRLAIAVKPSSSAQPVDVADEVATCSLTRLFVAYIAAYLAAIALRSVLFAVPQLTQIIVAAINVRWALAFVVAFTVLRRRERYDLLVVMLLLEVVTGAYSYFSSFNRIFFTLLVVMPIAAIRFSGRLRVAAVLVVLTVALFSVAWSAIKPDYRAYLNQGGGQQEVLVPAGDALRKVVELVSNLDLAAMAQAAELLVRRIAYVDFFAATLNYVPAIMPHQNGSLWLGAVTHVLHPRLLFPEKAELDDSEQTRTFTGLKVAGAAEGTSISLGYFAESYIDFGPIGMIFPIFALGLFYGVIYRVFVFHAPVRILGFGVATSMFIAGASNVGTSNVKLIGGNLMTLAVMWVLQRHLLVPVAAWAGIAVRRSLSTPSPSTDLPNDTCPPLI